MNHTAQQFHLVLIRHSITYPNLDQEYFGFDTNSDFPKRFLKHSLCLDGWILSSSVACMCVCVFSLGSSVFLTLPKIM